MRAVIAPDPGGPDALVVADLPDPKPGPGELVIDMAATAVNRADTLQRQGFYPPPPGASDVLGLECSGVVSAVGEGVEAWSVGDEVCALLAGGGYGEKVLVPAGQVMPVPDGLDLVTAGALPEVACTVWSNVFMIAGLREDETLLVHGGGGGIGTFAIQLAHALGARVLTTAGSEEKLEVCRSLGADVAINYREQDFVEEVAKATDGKGADVILDNMGAKYLPRNVDALATEGRLVVIGMQGGTKAELDLGVLMRKRGAVIATSLRARPVDEKAAICASVVEHVWPIVADGAIRVLVHTSLPLEEAGEAHRIMEASDHIGKIVLTGGGTAPRKVGA
jgi:putative PIG3 family NAD(P)H quinone oxidoreductase